MAPMSWLFDSVLGLSLLAFTIGAVAVAVLAQITKTHSLKAAAWSAIVPGAGQWYAGARSRAAQFFVIDVSLVVLALLAVQNRTAVLKAWVRPRDLVLMMLGSLALLAYRVWSAYDALLLVGRTPGGAQQRGLRMAAVGSIAAVLLAPHAVFGYYDLTQYNLITSVFDAEDPVAAPTTTTTTGDPTSPPATVDPSAVPTTAAPSNEPAIWDGLERLNLLLLGADDSPTRRGIRTDTMIVVSIDPASGNAAMISIPRNYARAPLPAGQGLWDCNCFPQLLNDLYYEGTRNPDAFPGPGTGGENAIKGGISEILGIPIHYYAMVNLAGFVGIVDALGGVEINVPNEIVEPQYGGPGLSGLVVIEEGLQVMDGYTALAYSRIRSQSSDYARMNRQRCVVKAVLDQSDPLELLAAYPTIAGVLREAMQTDIPLSRLPDFIDLLPKIDTADVVALSITPPEYLAGFTAQGQNMYDAALIQEHVALILEGRPEEVSSDLGSGSLASACS
jgi:LCP family protein required for cell wall assembly